MSLNKQIVHLNMTGGLQKKDDQFLVIPSKLAVANNWEFADASTLILRGGQTQVSPTPIGGGTNMDNLWRMFEHQGLAGVECESSNGIVTPSGIRKVLGNRGGSSASAAADPDNVPRCVATTHRAGRAARRTTATTKCKVQHDATANATHQMTVWEEQSGDGSHTIAYRIEALDDSSAVVISALTVPDPTYVNVALSPRVLPSSTGFWLCYAGYNYFAGAPSSFSVVAIPITNAGVVSAGTTIYTSAATGAIETTAANSVLFDAAATDASGVYQYGFAIRDTNAGGTLTLTARTATMAASFTRTLVPSALPRSLTAWISYSGATTRVHAFFGVGTNSVRSCFATSAAMSAEIAVGTPTATYLTGRIAVGSGSAHGSDIMIGYDATNTPGSYTLNKVFFSKFSVTHTSISECPGSVDGWYVAGHIHTDTGRAMMPLQVFTADTTSTLFVADLSHLTGNWGSTSFPPNVTARIAAGECVSPESPFDFPSRRLPAGFVYSGTGYRVSYLRMGRDLVTVNNTNETSWDVSVLRLSARYVGQLGFEEINNLTYLAGGCPYIFDGTQFVEEGFHHAPLVINSGSAAAAGTYGPFSAGACTFVFTEAWTDAQGNFHESAPSTEISVTFTGPNPYLAINVIRPPTRKPGSNLRVYRTKVASTDTSLYLTVTENGTNVTSDTTLASSEQIYTTGGVLPNTPAPACRHISTFQERLVLTGCEDGERVHWSKQTTPGYGVEFCTDDPTHQTQAQKALGRVVSSEEMDGRLYLLCSSGVGVMGGQGPSPTGTSGQYSDIESVITDVGCDEESPRSTIKAPEGIWFRARQGIRLISRSAALARSQDGKQAGAEVDSLVAGTCVGVVHKEKQQIRFYQSIGTVLVWDYQWQQWTLWTQALSVDAVVGDDSEVYHGSTDNTDYALVRWFDDTNTTDATEGQANASFSGLLRTPWLSFAGIQGFQRLYRLMLLAQCDNVNCIYSVTGNITYNFDDVALDTVSSLAVQPLSSGRIQLQHHFAQQKCESAQIELTVTSAETAEVGRFRLTDLTLQVGVKGGYFKTPSSQRF